MRLLLHAGTHKTGTSTIQRVLYDNAATLREHGVHYPDPRPWFGGTFDAHHPIAHAVARQDDDLPAARRMLDAVGDEAQGDVALLSAEPIYRHVLSTAPRSGWWKRHRAYLEALAHELSAFDVEVVLVFRRRDTFIESIYHERAAHGFGHSFEHVLERANRLLDYDRQLELFRACFPTVHVLDYAEIAGADLTTRFLSALGLPTPPLEAGEWDRRSVDARLSLWMVSAFADDPDPELVTQRRRFSKNPVSDRLFDDYGRVTFWTDPQARRALLDRYGDHRPIDDERAPAVLTSDDEARIDAAFDEYLIAKGLPPTGRAAQRSR